MSVDPHLDHLVYGVPDLDAGVEAVAALLGVDPAPGGRHPAHGTRNFLVGLGGRSYLEIIGPDPEADGPPTSFGLATLTEPRLVTWAVRPADIDATVSRARAAGHDPGDARPMSRRTTDGTLLEWRLTATQPLSQDGLIPFLIDWGATRHPVESGLPEVRLASLCGEHPDPDAVRQGLSAVDTHLEVVTAPAPALRATITTATGTVELS